MKIRLCRFIRNAPLVPKPLSGQAGVHVYLTAEPEGALRHNENKLVLLTVD